MQQQHETRYLSLFGSADFGELRIGEGEVPHRLVGLIPYNSLSVDMGGWRERIGNTAFRSSLMAGEDILALVDHSREKLLGRTGNQTLRLTDTPRGLEYVIDLPQTTYANDIRELARRGDLGGVSFGFRMRPNGQRFMREGGTTVRDLLDVKLGEISVISSHAAYQDTTVALRSANVDPSVLEQIPRPRLSRCERLLRISQ